ncbi:hypothetical protein SH139x_001239 [Planctomycetaceae bacterium SH139]
MLTELAADLLVFFDWILGFDVTERSNLPKTRLATMAIRPTVASFYRQTA